MPEIIETTVYRLGELSESAREKARSWYREIGFEHDWHEFVFDDFVRIGEILGLTFKTRPIRLPGQSHMAHASKPLRTFRRKSSSQPALLSLMES